MHNPTQEAFLSVKLEFKSFNQDRNISSLNNKLLKSVDQYIYLRSNISWTTIDRLPTTWKSDTSDIIKTEFFQAVDVSILLYGCTTWTVTKQLEKNS